MDTFENTLSQGQPAQQGSFTSEDLKAGVAPYTPNTVPTQYSKYDLANPDTQNGSINPSLHYPTAYSGIQPQLNQAPDQTNIAQAPLPQAEVPKIGGDNKRLTQIFIGFGLLTLVLLIGGGIFIYSAIYKVDTVTEEVTPTVQSEDNTQTTSGNEESTGVSSAIPEEAPATVVEDNSAVVAPAPAKIADATPPVEDPGIEESAMSEAKTLTQTGPSIGSIFANLAISIAIYILLKYIILRFSYSKILK